MGKHSYGAWLPVIYLQLPECSGDPSSYFLVQPYLYFFFFFFTYTVMAEWQLLYGHDLEFLRTPGHSSPVSPEQMSGGGVQKPQPSPATSSAQPHPSQPSQVRENGRCPLRDCHTNSLDCTDIRLFLWSPRYVGKVHQKVRDSRSHFPKDDQATKVERLLSLHSFQPHQGHRVEVISGASKEHTSANQTNRQRPTRRNTVFLLHKREYY